MIDIAQHMYRERSEHLGIGSAVKDALEHSLDSIKNKTLYRLWVIGMANPLHLDLLKNHLMLFNMLAGVPGVDLSGADLRGFRFRLVRLDHANLSHTDLRGVDLSGTAIGHANLSRANLANANLSRADLSGAFLGRANLTGADLRNADLVDSIFDEAILTDAQLWESQRSGWSINGIICSRAFWGRNGDRDPPSVYAPGEFERAYADKPQIRLLYPKGIEPAELAMLPLIVERLQQQHPNAALYIRSVTDEGSSATVVITVDDLARRNSEEVHQEIEQLKCELSYARGQLDLMKPWFQEWMRMGKNQIHIGQIDGPTVIDGTQQVREVVYSQSDFGVISRHVSQLLADRALWESKVAEANRAQFEATLKALKQELAEGQGDSSTIRDYLTNVIAGVTASAIDGPLKDLIQLARSVVG